MLSRNYFFLIEHIVINLPNHFKPKVHYEANNHVVINIAHLCEFVLKGR
jgi:hypothetical protein